MFRPIRELYCIVKWGITGINPCHEARRLGIEMANKGLSSLVKKLFMLSPSSTVGTGTVLGLHGAISPEQAKIQDSTLNYPRIDDSRAMVKFDMDGLTRYFTISMFALVFLIMMGDLNVLWVFPIHDGQKEAGGGVEK